MGVHVGDQTVMICRRLLSLSCTLLICAVYSEFVKTGLPFLGGGIGRADCCLVSLCLFVFIVTKYTDEKVDT